MKLYVAHWDFAILPVKVIIVSRKGTYICSSIVSSKIYATHNHL